MENRADEGIYNENILDHYTVTVTGISSAIVITDLNGGYGTHDYFGDSILSNMFTALRGMSVNLPLLSFVYIYTIYLQFIYILLSHQRMIPI